jgi:hypothetical protein
MAEYKDGVESVYACLLKRRKDPGGQVTCAIHRLHAILILGHAGLPLLDTFIPQLLNNPIPDGRLRANPDPGDHYRNRL